MNLSRYSKQILFAPFSAPCHAASLSASLVKSLKALERPATIHWMVAAQSSIGCEAAQQGAKKCIKNHLFKSSGIGS